MLFCVIEILVSVAYRRNSWQFLTECFVSLVSLEFVRLSSLSVGLKGIPSQDLIVLFDIVILNVGTFITGASVRNFVFVDLYAFEVSNRNISFFIS